MNFVRISVSFKNPHLILMFSHIKIARYYIKLITLWIKRDHPVVAISLATAFCAAWETNVILFCTGSLTGELGRKVADNTDHKVCRN